ncbi:MAG: hypothetical protein ACK5JD_03535 [Mangrovibacterium sp.]
MKVAKKNQNISRKEFLQLGGSIIAGGAIIGLSGVTLWKNYKHKAAAGEQTSTNLVPGAGDFQSPYKLVSSFATPDRVESMELLGNKLISSTSKSILVYNLNGSLDNSFPISGTLRDMAVSDEKIYLMFSSRFEVYNVQGEMLASWEACNENADYCSLAIGGNAVFATDATNKYIVKYSASGAFDRIIESPNRFIIPSYTFGITYSDGFIYCSNAGRHQVEKYTADGMYIGAFGGAGIDAGQFCGCCNPAYLTHSENGEIITSEKGNPRISCYDRDGNFLSLLLDSKTLGGGNAAFRIKTAGDKLYVAGKNLISVFQYDPAQASQTACASCGIVCPLRKGTLI